MSKYQVGDLVCVEPKNIDGIWPAFLKYVGRKGYVVHVYEKYHEDVRYLLDFCEVSWHEYNLQPVDNLSMDENEVLCIFRQ